MAFIVISVLLLLIGGAGLIVAHYADNTITTNGRNGSTTTKNNPTVVGGRAAAAAALLLVLILAVTMSYNRVPQREVGVVQSFSGSITGVTGHGNVWVAPWSNVSTVNIGLTREDFVLDDNNSAVSSDQQPIFADLTLNYNLDATPDKVLKLFKTVGPNWKAILIDSRVLQDFKEVTATFTAQEITTKREQLRAETKSRLTTELGKYDITVDDFFVKNLSYTQSYRDAINNKNVQVQSALQAKAKVAQAKYEADQAVATATGEAKSTLVKAQAEAKALAVKGRALHDNPEILKLEAIDKLNPAAKVIICTGNCPSFLPDTGN